METTRYYDIQQYTGAIHGWEDVGLNQIWNQQSDAFVFIERINQNIQSEKG